MIKAMAASGAINRTKVELKRSNCINIRLIDYTINRTKVELKLN